MFGSLSFRRTDNLAILQYSTECPIDYRLDDANRLAAYLDCENELEQEPDSDDDFDDEPTSFGRYHSSS